MTLHCVSLLTVHRIKAVLGFVRGRTEPAQVDKLFDDDLKFLVHVGLFMTLRFTVWCGRLLSNDAFDVAEVAFNVSLQTRFTSFV